MPAKDCDVCKVMFGSSKPNVAKYDGNLGGGLWGYACEIHKVYIKGRPIKLKVPTVRISRVER